MNIVLSVVCAGKTTLASKDDNFVDLDIFASSSPKIEKTVKKESIHKFFEWYSENCDDTKTYLMTLNKFHDFGLSDITTINVTDIILVKDLDFRKQVWLDKYETTEDDLSSRERGKLNAYLGSFEKYLNNRAEYYSNKLNIELHYLEEGKFLYDYFHSESTE